MKNLEESSTQTQAQESGQGYRPDEERLAAIEHTLHETKDAEDTQFRQLVADATTSYWQNLERDARLQTSDLDRETATEAARAFLYPRRTRRIFSGEFWQEIAAAILPPFALAGIYQLLLRSEGGHLLVHPRRYAMALAAIFFSVLALVGYSIARKSGAAYLNVLLRSLGSLAAGVCLALAALALLASEVKERRDASINRLEALAVLSLQQKHQRGSFLETAVLSQVSTDEVTLDRAVYKTDVDSGVFVADISSTGGSLALKGRDRDHIFAEFLVGKIVRIGNDRFVLAAPDGSRQEIRVGRGAVEPTENSVVAVSVNPNTHVAQAIVPIEWGAAKWPESRGEQHQ
jgi:hypothetical protein